MLEKIKLFKDNILLFSIGCYGLGFIYLFTYYYAFNLPIIFYINYNDILLFALTIILPSAVISLILNLVVFVIIKKAINKILSLMNFNSLSENKLHICILALILISLLAIITFYYYFEINPRIQFFIFISMSSAMLWSMNFKTKYDMILQCGIFSLFLFAALTANTYNTQRGKITTDVSFKYNQQEVHTPNTNLVYLGETSSSIFLYGPNAQKTYVYEKDKISNLEYSEKSQNFYGLFNKINYRDLYDFQIKPENKTLDKRYEWISIDNHNFSWKAEQTSKGIAKILWKIEDILVENDYKLEAAMHDNTFLPKDLKIKDDCKLLNEALKSGDYEVSKKWFNFTGTITLILNKNEYCIYLEKK